MNVTVSHNAFYCAHCGHIEPLHSGYYDNSIYVHKDDCSATVNFIAHDMFLSLANSMTHMRMNDALTDRVAENIATSMLPFANEYLKDNSHAYKWINKSMYLR